MTPERARELFGSSKDTHRPVRWKNIWSAGHAVSGVNGVSPATEIVAQTEREWGAARYRLESLMEMR